MGYRVIKGEPYEKRKAGSHVYSIATGRVNPESGKSIRAARHIKHQFGYVTMCRAGEQGCLWFFDTLEHARFAAKRMQEVGIKFGENIGQFAVSETGDFDFEKNLEVAPGQPGKGE